MVVLYILLGIVALVALVVIVAALKAPEFRITRSAVISAPAAAVFARVNDMRAWNDWSPWAKLDPGCKYTYEGPASGTGASMSWSGNNKVGSGRMTITDSKPAQLIGFKLEFFRPFKATNAAEFTFSSQGSQTSVVWSMTGKNNFFCKMMGLFMDMDKMVGKDFEKGLAQLKSLTESSTSVSSSPALVS